MITTSLPYDASRTAAGRAALSRNSVRPRQRRSARFAIEHLESRTLLSGYSQLADYGHLPLGFEINRGQAAEQVDFLARGSRHSLWLTASEAVLAFELPAVAAEESADAAILQMQLLGADAAARVAGLDQLPGLVNYLIGDDPRSWHVGIPTYGKVHYQDVYPGIDLVYYGTSESELEYDFIVAPGADPNAIALNFDGVDTAEISETGDLVLHVAGHELVWRRPSLYQQSDAGSVAVDGSYILTDSFEVRFEVEDYDAARPLIIDPVLEYSSFLGGVGHAVAVDSQGNAYITGGAGATNLPFATAGAFQAAYSGGSGGDAFVAKVNATGTAVVYRTYLGGGPGPGEPNDAGSGRDLGLGIAVDAAGNAYVTGYTNSPNFPTRNAAQPASGGGLCQFWRCLDAFVTTLNATGTDVVYSSFWGGSADEIGYGIDLDNAGNAYVAGVTLSSNFPTTPGAVESPYAWDAFVAKFDPAGAIAYSARVGGPSVDEAHGIAVDDSGNAYITGRTAGVNLVTPDAAQTAYGGAGDSFVSKLSPTGSTVLYYSYLGGTSSDFGNAIAVDNSGTAYVAGMTELGTFPTKNAVQAGPGSGRDAFVAKIDTTVAGPNSVVYATVLGGNNNDQAFAIAIDAAGNAYVTGETNAPIPNAQTTGLLPQVNPLQPYGGGSFDAFVSAFDPAGALAFSTYLGGTPNANVVEAGYGIAVDRFGGIYVTGATDAANFPTTPGAFETTFTGSFLTKITSIFGPGDGNTAPDAIDDTATTDEDTVAEIDVLANDTDAEGNIDPTSVVVLSGPEHGATQVDSVTGAVTYIPSPDFNGTDSFTYRVCDSAILPLCDAAMVTVPVNAVSDPPAATPQQVTTHAATVVAIALAGTDPDGDPLSFAIATPPAHGVLSGAAPNVTYTPASGFFGSDSFTFTVSDGGFTSQPATVFIIVLSPCSEPGPNLKSCWPGNGDALDHADGNNATVSGVTFVTGQIGQAFGFTGQAGQRVRVPHAASLNIEALADASFTGWFQSNTAVDAVIIAKHSCGFSNGWFFTTNQGGYIGHHIGGVGTGRNLNDGLPHHFAVVKQGTSYREYVDGVLTGSDSGPAGNTTNTIDVQMGGTTGGSCSNYGQLTGFDDEIAVYGRALSTAEVVAIYQAGLVPPNSTPTARAGGPYEIDEGDSLALSAAASSDPDNDPLTYSWDLNGDDVYGDATSATPTVTWTQLQALGIGDEGVFTVSVRLDDGQGHTSDASATLTVRNTAPSLAISSDGTVDEGSTYTLNLSASDPGDDTIAHWVISWGDGAIDTIDGNPSFAIHVYEDGPASFSVTATARDEDGTFDAGNSVSVAVQNLPPLAAADARTTDEDVPLTFSAADLLGNDTDPGGDSLEVVSVAADPGSHVTVFLVDGLVVCIPEPDFYGTTSFTYTIGDGDGGFTTGTVSVTTNPVNDPPSANDDFKEINEGESIAFPVEDFTGNDTDVEDDSLTVVSVEAEHGTATLEDGIVTFTPDPDFNGEAFVHYTIDDGHGGAARCHMHIKIRPKNNPPVPIADELTTPEDTALEFAASELAANDSAGPANERDQTLTVAAVSATASTHGDVLLASGTIVYTPDLDYFGPASFSYTVCDDGTSGDPPAPDPKCSIGVVQVTVTPVNDPPRAAADSKDTAEDVPLTFPATDLTTNDSPGPANESDQVLTVLSVAATMDTHGSVSLASGSVTYVPELNFSGAASFEYTVCDNGVTGLPPAADPLCDTATVHVTVTATAGTPGKITGGGHLDGQARNFGLVAQSKLKQGTLTYQGNIEFQDRTLGLNLHSTAVTLVEVDPDGIHGMFKGTARVNGVAGYTFRVNVEDRGEPGKHDVFRIRVVGPNGFSYDSLTDATLGGQLDGGNIQIHKSASSLTTTDSTADDTSGVSDDLPALITSAGQLLTGIITVSLPVGGGNLPTGYLERTRDAMTTLNEIFSQFGVTLVETSGEADVVIELAAISECGTAYDGVLGCTADGSVITLIEGWNWYAGADATGVAGDQFDFQTIVTHELGHALGLAHSHNPDSVMYAWLAAGVARRNLAAADVAIHEDEHAEPDALRVSQNHVSASTACPHCGAFGTTHVQRDRLSGGDTWTSRSFLAAFTEPRQLLTVDLARLDLGQSAFAASRPDFWDQYASVPRDDILIAGDGDDLHIGHAGRDQLIGGVGTDDARHGDRSGRWQSPADSPRSDSVDAAFHERIDAMLDVLLAEAPSTVQSWTVR